MVQTRAEHAAFVDKYNAMPLPSHEELGNELRMNPWLAAVVYRAAQQKAMGEPDADMELAAFNPTQYEHLHDLSYGQMIQIVPHLRRLGYAVTLHSGEDESCPFSVEFEGNRGVDSKWRSAIQPAQPAYGEREVLEDTAPHFGATRTEKETQQLAYTLVNNAQPALQSVLGSDFGSWATTNGVCSGGKEGLKGQEKKTRKGDQRAAERAERIREQEAERELLEAELLAVKEGQIKKLNTPALNKLMNDAGIFNPGYEVSDNPVAFVRKEMEGLPLGESDEVNATDEAWRQFIGTPRNRKSAWDKARNKYIMAVENEVGATPRWRKMAAEGSQATYDKVKGLVTSMNKRIAKIKAQKKLMDKASINGDQGDRLAAKGLYLSRASMDIRTLKSVNNIIRGYLQDGTIVVQGYPVLAGSFPGGGDVAMPEDASADADDATLELLHHLELAIAECGHMLQLSAMHDKVFGCLEALPEAPVSTGAKPRGRSKTPPKSRTGAAAAASTEVRAPAAASGMSTMPLVPTSASPIVDAVTAAASAAVNAVANTLAPVAATPASTFTATATATASSAAPRRRAREGGESSTTNSVFENMFAASPTAAAPEEPASPTPSSGSEGQASGPRTFRRIQR